MSAVLNRDAEDYLHSIVDYAEGRITRMPGEEAASGMNRRSFLKLTGMAGGGFALAFYVDGKNVAHADVIPGFAPNAYVHIAKDNTITIYAKNPEIGQGVKTALPMIVAEELDADWATVKVVQSAISPAYGQQMAGGSRSVPSNWDTLRKAGATAKAMLTAAAAKKWKVPATELTADKSAITHASGKRATYGELADLAATIKVPADSELTLKTRDQYKLLGKRITGVDNHAIVTGQPLFGIDQQMPGLLYAAYEKCPAHGGKVKSANIDAIKAMPGVKDCFVVDGTEAAATGFPGVAVIATSTWAAFQAKKALKVEWDESNAASDSWTESVAKAKELATAQGDDKVKEKGDVEAVFAAPNAQTVESFYTYPFVSHAPLEPQNCTAWYKDGAIEFWAPTQMPTPAIRLAATAAGVPPEKVKINQTRVGGGFGRRLSNDYMCEVAMIAKRVDGPVKLTWTREDDMTHDMYRPGGFHSFKGAIDKSTGKITAWQDHFITFGSGPRPASAMNGNEVPAPFLENFRLTQTKLPLGQPTGPWRAPGSNSFGWVTQSFIHELAVKAGLDHRDVLLKLFEGEPRQLAQNEGGLHTGRATDVIKLVTEKAGWGRQMPAGRGLGLAFYYSHAGHFAEVAEVSVDKNKKITLHKVWVAGDVGQIVNMSGAENQAEGCVIDGFSTMMGLAITYENGRVQQNNFHQYPLLRIKNAPVVESHFIQSDFPPTGIGEPALPPLLPAVANAIFAAIGHRVRTLPLTAEGFSV